MPGWASRRRCLLLGRQQNHPGGAQGPRRGDACCVSLQSSTIAGFLAAGPRGEPPASTPCAFTPSIQAESLPLSPAQCRLRLSLEIFTGIPDLLGTGAGNPLQENCKHFPTFPHLLGARLVPGLNSLLYGAVTHKGYQNQWGLCSGFV